MVSILHYLMDELEEYANKLVDLLVMDQYIKDLPLEDLKGVLTARQGQLCARLKLLRTAQNNLQIGVLRWEDVFLHFKMVVVQMWLERWIARWSCVICRVNLCKMNSEKGSGLSRENVFP